MVYRLVISRVVSLGRNELFVLYGLQCTGSMHSWFTFPKQEKNRSTPLPAVSDSLQDMYSQQCLIRWREATGRVAMPEEKER